jgi:hypothetical protein
MSVVRAKRAGLSLFNVIFVLKEKGDMDMSSDVAHAIVVTLYMDTSSVVAHVLVTYMDMYLTSYKLLGILLHQMMYRYMTSPQ